MGLNLKTLKMSLELFTCHNIQSVAGETDRLPKCCIKQRCYNIRKFTADAILFIEVQSKKKH